MARRPSPRSAAIIHNTTAASDDADRYPGFTTQFETIGKDARDALSIQHCAPRDNLLRAATSVARPSSDTSGLVRLWLAEQSLRHIGRAVNALAKEDRARVFHARCASRKMGERSSPFAGLVCPRMLHRRIRVGRG